MLLRWDSIAFSDIPSNFLFPNLLYIIHLWFYSSVHSISTKFQASGSNWRMKIEYIFHRKHIHRYNLLTKYHSHLKYSIYNRKNITDSRIMHETSNGQNKSHIANQIHFICPYSSVLIATSKTNPPLLLSLSYSSCSPSGLHSPGCCRGRRLRIASCSSSMGSSPSLGRARRCG